MNKFGVILNDFKKNPLFLFRITQWAVGVVENYSYNEICNKVPNNIIWIKGDHAGDFYADPFITDYFGEPIVFFENFIDTKGRGIISYVSVKDIKEHGPEIQKYIHTALDFETHLSYPYLFVYNEELYMVPENCMSHTISLYKAGSTPSKWNKVSVLIPDFDGVDTTIFEYNNVWYMFSTQFVGGTTSDNSELHIWYSDNPLGGWKKHSKSPFIYDNLTARCAGYPFIIDGVLYRPAQDCSRTYGGELLIKKITELTPDTFSEEIVKKIPGVQPFEDSFHTFCSSGNISVIDGARNKISLAHIPYAIKRMVKRFVG